MHEQSSLQIVHQFAVDVAEGRIETGSLFRKACQRHLKDLEHGASRGLRFDESRALHVLEFFSFLRHSKGEWAGKPFELQPWQMFLLAVLFGWVREDGRRRFRNAYTEIARKNGKSTLAAGIGLYLFFADGEAGAEVYAAATKRDQAKIVHSEAIRMVRASKTLLKRIAVFRDNLNDPRTYSKFEPLGADEDTLDGLNVHGAIIDELHAHKTRGVYDILDTATGSRREPLIFSITTAGSERESICYELHDYGEKILDEIIQDDTFFVLIACADKNDDWTLESTWRKANPNFEVSVKKDDLERKCERATKLASYQNTFMRLHLNIWTEQENRWLMMDKWKACGDQFDTDALVGEPCWAGLDLSTTTDITCLSLVFPQRSGVKVLPFFFVPEETVKERSIRDRVPYDVWAKQGYIEITDGNVVDYDYVRFRANELAKLFNIREFAYDPWNATQLANQLKNDGINTVEFRQGYAALSPPSKEFEKLVVAKRLEHRGNPVLTWMASNVAIRSDPAGNIKPAKDKSSDRIDGIVATVMGLGSWMLSEGHNSYENRGLIVLTG